MSVSEQKKPGSLIDREGGKSYLPDPDEGIHTEMAAQSTPAEFSQIGRLTYSYSRIHLVGSGATTPLLNPSPFIGISVPFFLSMMFPI